MIRMFDFYRRWNDVRPLLSLPPVLAALDTVMCHATALHGGTWDANKGPWSCSRYPELYPTIPERDSIDWYRVYGCCWQINTWAGVLGELLMPELIWRVVVNRQHCAAVGFSDVPQVMMDVVWGPTQPIAEDDLSAERLYAEFFSPAVAAVSVDEALDVIRRTMTYRPVSSYT